MSPWAILAGVLLVGLASEPLGAQDAAGGDPVRVTRMELVLDRVDPGRSAPAAGFVDFGAQRDASRPFAATRDGTRVGQRLYIGETARRRARLDGAWPLRGR